MKYTVTAASEQGHCNFSEHHITFTADKAYEQAFFRMEITLPEWEPDSYLFMPACAYNGNRFQRVVRRYPPMYRPEETGVDAPPLMTDVPALNPDGSGEMQVTTGDMAVPCVGVFNRAAKRGFLFFTEQQVGDRNIGFTVRAGQITVCFPAARTDIYRFCLPHDTAGDTGIPVEAGQSITARYAIHTFACEDIPAFFRTYFSLRKSLMSDPRAPFGYTRELWDLMEEHFNTVSWSGQYYSDPAHLWQCGWVTGIISVLPLLRYGSPLSRQHSISAIDFLTSHQAPSGLYYGMITKEGAIGDDSFHTPGMENIHLIRKSADALYYLFKFFELTEPKPAWIDSARRCAEAFVSLFGRYGQFGQFVDIDTGDIRVGGTFCGVMAIGALAKAATFFGEPRYLETARRAMRYYYDRFAQTGVTNGGPGEILGAPDSESAFAMLESAVTLAELDPQPIWLNMAETLAWFCSSWVVTYRYRFPEGCEFHRLQINSVGSVFASVQNKHSAPGICTHSGDSLLKLYRWTGDERYLELLKDIAYCLPQCVSTEERPIYSWDHPPIRLPAGFIYERVNMSDWEGPDAVGGVAYGCCWSETSLTLCFSELMTQPELLP